MEFEEWEGKSENGRVGMEEWEWKVGMEEWE